MYFNYSLIKTELQDDLQLFHQIANGDEKAFETIFHRYTPKLRPFVTGIVKVASVADEIVQEVFLKLWINRETLIHINEPASWLYRVASNHALNQLRKQANEYKKIKQVVLDDGSSEEVFEKLTAKELQMLIHEAVSLLPEKRKQIYLLTREEGLSHKDVSHRLNISASTVKNQVVLAVKAIQAHILDKSGVYIPVILLSVKINFASV